MMKIWADLTTPGRCAKCQGQLMDKPRYGMCDGGEYIWYAHRCKTCQTENVYLNDTTLKKRISLSAGQKCILKSKTAKTKQTSLL